MELHGQRFLCFVGDDYEDLEVWYPRLRLIEAGMPVNWPARQHLKNTLEKMVTPAHQTSRGEDFPPKVIMD